jgi:hypothetical protein
MVAAGRKKTRHIAGRAVASASDVKLLQKRKMKMKKQKNHVPFAMDTGGDEEGPQLSRNAAKRAKKAAEKASQRKEEENLRKLDAEIHQM